VRGNGKTWTFCAAWLALFTVGCATTTDHEMLMARVAKLESDRNAIQKQMVADVERLARVKADLVKTLAKAEKTLRESGANLGLRVSRMETQIPKLRGTLETLEFQFKHLIGDIKTIRALLVKRLDAVQLLIPKDLPEEADGMWVAAERYRTQGRERVARAIYQRFEASHAKDKRAPQARMIMAGMQVKAGNINEAIKLYGTLEQYYPKSVLVPKAILRVGELLVKQRRCRKAKSVYGYLATTYKDTTEGRVAAQRAAKIKLLCK